MVIETNILPPGAGAFTAYPFMFIRKGCVSSYLAHETVHYEQQRRWAIYGLGVGLLVWFALYLFALPVGWNPFRAKWEREAFRQGSHYTDEAITRILQRPPYYLWWAHKE